MSNLIAVYRSNLRSNSALTIGVTIGHLIVISVLAQLFVTQFEDAVLSFAASTIVVCAVSNRIPRLSWFWRDPNKAKTKEKPSQSASMLSSTDQVAEPKEQVEERATPEEAEVTDQRFEGVVAARYPRLTPQGTYLSPNSNEELAVMRVKVAIRFWCFALPTFFSVLSVPLAFVSAVISVAVLGQRGGLRPDDVFMYMGASAVISFSVCLIAAVISYHKTRPEILVHVDKDRIRIGTETYDRRFAGAVVVGHTERDTEVSRKIISPQFGSVALGIQYGRWGETTNYMLDAEHASETVVWMNEVIDSVGDAQARRYDPQAGKKIELL